MKALLNTIYFLFILIFLLICGASEYFKYLNVKKHFKEMTFIEYLSLEDKLIITPNHTD
jgi:hypothetical protein